MLALQCAEEKRVQPKQQEHWRKGPRPQEGALRPQKRSPGGTSGLSFDPFVSLLNFLVEVFCPRLSPCRVSSAVLQGTLCCDTPSGPCASPQQPR